MTRFATMDEAIEGVKLRLKAEKAACEIDPTLEDNEFVEGVIWTLRWWLGEIKG